MTSNSPQPPDLDRVEKGFKAVTGLTNTLTEFLRWVAGMIRKRQWVDLLMFAIAIAVVFLLTKFTFAQFVKEPIFYGAWMGLGVIFLVGLSLELRKRPALKTIVPGKRKAIKFLSSFELEDAEIYGRLQGYRDLGLILETIVLPDFRFGVLTGRSGCGKSSYLKAGLLAALAKTEAYRGVYIKFSNLDPLVTIREALVDALKLPKAEVEALGLIELLNRGIEAAAEGSPSFKSLILIFDQFEQFFVYTDDAKRRTAFIQALASWYGNDALKEKVKILVSIREDWFARMTEIQTVLNYTLRIGGQSGGNLFYLKNFSAEEATMILGVMAQEDLGIEAEDTVRFDRDYIQEVLERELASPTDHLISPVDLQIIAETIKQQNRAELRSFNRTALQRLGGIEGLRRSFLESILEPLGAERQKSAVQVLVALTNLEQQTRAQVQTLEQLQEKVKGIILPQEVERIVGSLQETGLIAQAERGGVRGYELAHEGMIGAVIRVGEKVQDGAYRANQLLERRVNEWLGNGRSSRYLFSLRELWLLKQQRPFLVWGSKQEYKQRLIANSQQRVRRNLGLVAIVPLMGVGVWGWLNYTIWGQLTQVRWRLTQVSQQISSTKYLTAAAFAFAKDGDFSQVSKLANRIDASSPKASANALSAIAKAYGKLNQSDKAVSLLKDALVSANKIDDSSDKANALSAIAGAIGKLNQSDKAVSLLKDALVSANKIDDLSDKANANALSAIAKAYGKLNQSDKAVSLLKDALVSANKIDDFSFFLSDKANALSAIAEVYGKLNQSDKAIPLLKDALVSVNKIDNFSYLSPKGFSLRPIVGAFGKLNQSDKAVSLLKDALVSANEIDDSSGKANALSAIAETYRKLNQADKAVPLLKDALVSANKINDSSYISSKGVALSAIAEAYGKLNQADKTLPLLKVVLDSANKIDDSSDKANALSAIAEAYGKLKNWGQALKVAQLCPSKDCEVDALAKILTSHAEQQHPELKEEEEE